MARVKIRRRNAGGYSHMAAVRSAFAALTVLFSIVTFQAFADASTPFLARGAVVSIALDPPKPYDPVSDPSRWLLPVQAGPVTTGMNSAVPAEAPQSPFVMPDAESFSPGVAATPYVFQGRTPTDQLRASLCLTAAIYYEAANEPDDGQRAVAQVVLNRVRHPAWPDTICDVVYQGTERPGTLCQFTFGCDGALARPPSTAGWQRARRVALAALAGYVHAPAGLATHYHTLAVAPSWGKSLTPVGIYGAHIFYRLPGGAGSPRAFTDRYRGVEPLPAPRPKVGLPPVLLPDTAGMPVSAIAPAPMTMPLVPDTASSAMVNSIAPRTSVAADRRYVPGSLPDSDIKDEYRNSGSWIVR